MTYFSLDPILDAYDPHGAASTLLLSLSHTTLFRSTTSSATKSTSTATRPATRSGFTASSRSWGPGPPSRTATSSRRPTRMRSEEHTAELQSRQYLVCRLLLEKKNEEGMR